MVQKLIDLIKHPGTSPATVKRLYRSLQGDNLGHNGWLRVNLLILNRWGRDVLDGIRGGGADGE